MSDQHDGPQITVRPNGPYLVSGGVPISRRHVVASELAEPLAWQTAERFEPKPMVALCRCGGSASKPFCDGTHARNGFDGTEHASTTTYDERAKAYDRGTKIVVRDDRSICEHAGFCGNHATNVWQMVKPAIEDTVVRAQMMAMVANCPSRRAHAAHRRRRRRRTRTGLGDRRDRRRAARGHRRPRGAARRRRAVRGAQPDDAVPLRIVGQQAAVRRQPRHRRLRRPLTRGADRARSVGHPPPPAGVTLR